tara:strand:+ start:406 stop:1014 length:609 start_codon:yes stop_codon:yes gene_type:complete
MAGIYAEDRGFLFMHIPKTGGTSVSHVLQNHMLFKGSELKMHTDHKTLLQWSKIIGNKFNKLFKVTCIRNPFSFMVSLYNFARYLQPESIWYESSRKGFNYFTEYFCSSKESFNYMDYIQVDNKICVDFFIRLENLKEDLEEMFREIANRNLISLDTLQNTETIPIMVKGKTVNYRSYYDEATAELVQNKFKKEIELFKYNF